MKTQTKLRCSVRDAYNTVRAWVVLALVMALVSLCLPASRAQSGCAPLSRGLVGWWQGNGDFADLVSGNNGSAVGSVGFSSGEVGLGFVLDGPTSGVVLNDTAALRLQNFTIEAWLQRSSLSIVSSSPGGAVIFGYGAGGYALAIANDGRLFLSKIAIDGIFSTASITDGNLHHVAVTKIGTNVIFYLDGTAYAAPPYSSTFSFSSAPAVGFRADLSSASFLGLIDEVGVYNRALSGGEVRAIFLAGSDGKCVGPTPPAIVDQPADQGTTLGSNAAFTVVAAGTEPLSYQWQSHGTNRLAGTDSSLILTNVQPGDLGDYQVVIANNYGSATSVVATLSLKVPPSITSQPQSLSAVPGSTVSFSVGVAGSLPLSFRWQLNSNDVTGAIHYSLSITNVQASDAGSYRVIVQNTLGSVTSAPAVLTVLVPPTITNQPLSQIVPAGSNPGFSVAVAGHGAPPLKYQWRFLGTNLPGATNSLLSLNDVQAANAGLYSVVVTDTFGLTISSNAALTVTNPICASAPAGLAGWWQAEGSAENELDGAPALLVGNAGFAAGKVGAGFRFDGSGDAVVVGNPAALQLQDFTIEAWVKRSSTGSASSSSGGGVIFGYGHGGYSFAMDNSGRPFLTQIDLGSQSAGFQVRDTNWHHLAVTKSGTDLAFYLDGAGYPGSTPFNVTFQFTTPAAVGARADSMAASFLGLVDEVALFSRGLSSNEIQSLYFATGQGKCPFGPSVVVQPTNQFVNAGQAVLFLPQIAGTRPLVCQWRLNGTLVSGATGPSLALSNVTFFQAGNYSVKMTNSAGSAATSNATLTVLPALLLQNGGFETGDFTGWILNDISFPLSPLAIRGAGYNSGFGFFSTAPTDGSFCLTHGFDGDGPGRIRAAIDVVLPASPVMLTFSYRVAWDMEDFGGSTKPRTFGVTIEPFGGGVGLQTNTLLTAAPGTANFDTGDLVGSMDLSAYSGRGIRISFDATIPESFTGPGFFQLDHVELSYAPRPPLIISRAGTNVVLSWPLSFSNFIPLLATNLPLGNWTAIATNLIVPGPTANALTLPISPGRSFFRLRSP